MKEVFEYALQGRISSRNNYARRKVPFCKTNNIRDVSHVLVPRFGKNRQDQ